jgi:hypothetical protein
MTEAFSRAGKPPSERLCIRPPSISGVMAEKDAFSSAPPDFAAKQFEVGTRLRHAFSVTKAGAR